MRAVPLLIREIRNTIKNLAHEDARVRQVLSVLDGMDFSEKAQNNWETNKPCHALELTQAIDSMSPKMGQLANALNDSLPQLQWRVDQGTYYDPAADIGDGYRTGNMHCELIGPRGSAFYQEDFTLGLFLLTPRVLYRDHTHAAPELYLTLSQPSGWRFDGGDWHDVPSGQIIWNAPEAVHATKVYDTPFLAIYSWVKNIHSKCRIVPRNDWDDIEEALKSS